MDDHRCTLCAISHRKVTGRHAPRGTQHRIPVGGVMVCPIHDFVGPVVSYPDRVREAIGHE